MFSLLKLAYNKLKSSYHKIMYTYNFILFRDCLDIQLKEKFYKNQKYHEKKIHSNNFPHV
ncbi:hypothetical protein CON65_16140 [Bacillus pseudomycoides]|uniref:Uncharacterized protein n=1 Tax=Bacillus pseudomycoides TaxID=64104 RepID=A0AA91ZSG4_9BACI|nr:hypothetical protein COO03_01575 [Bacillus sp. AFS098217]PED81715.1 hypothetical protein CON65_16140 [Bacillus pseudomycoides]PEU09364.1 hypothetical protein CN525_24825 [Bacillus sp. AFS014408]PEU10643.1 hypothetical protein CN524_15985 [Bacillus sp. AFS019443]PFW64258.1 hypothetical protein COL20_05565 [Bacillus sp. AFS075034]